MGSDALQALAAADFRADADPDHLQNPDSSTHINLWYRLTTAFAEEEMMAYSAAPRHHLTVWYPSVGIYAARQGSWVLGAKFGSNGDSHNHNDTGSITVYKDGRPFPIDIGVESYTQKTFSPQRYEIWTMQSAWHNLPTFDGVQQLPGAEYAAREVCTDKNSITGELAGRVPSHPGAYHLPPQRIRQRTGHHPAGRNGLSRHGGADPAHRAETRTHSGRLCGRHAGRHPL